MPRDKPAGMPGAKRGESKPSGMPRQQARRTKEDREEALIDQRPAVVLARFAEPRLQAFFSSLERQRRERNPVPAGRVAERELCVVVGIPRRPGLVGRQDERALDIARRHRLVVHARAVETRQLRVVPAHQARPYRLTQRRAPGLRPAPTRPSAADRTASARRASAGSPELSLSSGNPTRAPSSAAAQAARRVASARAASSAEARARSGSTIVSAAPRSRSEKGTSANGVSIGRNVEEVRQLHRQRLRNVARGGARHQHRHQAVATARRRPPASPPATQS